MRKLTRFLPDVALTVKGLQDSICWVLGHSCVKFAKTNSWLLQKTGDKCMVFRGHIQHPDLQRLAHVFYILH